MFEIRDRITKPGAISFTEIDQAFLATVPPTPEVIARAKTLGQRLGELSAANEVGEHGFREIVSEVWSTANAGTALQTRDAFSTFAFIGYDGEQENMGVMSEALRTADAREGVTI